MKTETIHKNQTWALISASIDSNIQTISDDMGMPTMMINHGNSAKMEIKGVNANFEQFNFISFNGVGFHRVPESSMSEVVKNRERGIRANATRRVICELLNHKNPKAFLNAMACEILIGQQTTTVVAKSLGISRQSFTALRKKAKQTLEKHLQ